MREKSNSWQKKIKFVSVFIFLVLIIQTTFAEVYFDHSDNTTKVRPDAPQNPKEPVGTPSFDDIGAQSAYEAYLRAIHPEFTAKQKEERKIMENGQYLDYLVNNNYLSDAIGDPVIIASGEFDLSETDMLIRNGSNTLKITRRSLSGKKGGGSFGEGWSCSIDTRIIRSSFEYSEILKEYQKTIEDSTQFKNEIIQKDPYSIYIKKAEDEYENLLSQCKLVEQNVKKQQMIADLNKYVLYGEPSFYYVCGIGPIIYVTEEGTSLLCDYIGEGQWKPRNNLFAKKILITSTNFSDVLSSDGFIVTEYKKPTKHYNKWGQIVSITDKNQNTFSFEYEKNKLTRISTTENTDLTLKRDDKGRIVEITSITEDKVKYAYANERLINRTDIYDETVNYKYTNDGYLTGIVKPGNNNIISIEYGLEYNNRKYVTKTTDEEGNSEHFDYSLAGNKVIYTNHSGYTSVYVFDEFFRTISNTEPDGSETLFFYSPESYLFKTIKNGVQTLYNYNSYGDCIKKTYSDGTSEQYTYNDDGNLISYTNRDNCRQSYQYDSKGNCTAIYNNQYIVAQFSYNNKGLITSSTNASGLLTKYTYDKQNRLINRNTDDYNEKWIYNSRGKVTTYVDPLGQNWKYEYPDKTVIETTPNNLEKIYTFNNRLDLVKIKETDLLTSITRVKRYKYDKRHNIIYYGVSDGKTEDTYTEKYEYMPSGETKTRICSDGTESYKYTTNYDNCGRASSIEISKLDISGVIINSYKESYVYSDSYSIPSFKKEITPLNEVTTYTYDLWNRITSIKNPVNTINTIQYTPTGKLKQIQSEYGGFYDFTYDSSGFLTSLSESNGSKKTFRYNLNGTLASCTDGENNITNFEYDKYGRLTSCISTKKSFFFSYDKLGRVIYKSLGAFNKSNAEQWVSYKFNPDRTVLIDKGGVYTQKIVLNGWDEPISIIDGTGNTKRAEYDCLGRIISITDPYNKRITYQYNTLSLISKITLPDSSYVTYNYNEKGLVTEQRDQNGILWQGEYDENGRLIHEKTKPGIDNNYSYNSEGNLAALQTGNIVKVNYNYANRNKLLTLKNGKNKEYKFEKDDYGKIIKETNRSGYEKIYLYNRNNQITRIIDYKGNNINYIYTPETRTSTITYSDGNSSVITYDMAGNIISATNATGTILWSYNKAGQLIKQADLKAGENTYYEYDISGNRKSLKSTNIHIAYSYGKNNELISVQELFSGLNVRFEYDSCGRLKQKINGNKSIQTYSYDQAGNIRLIIEKDMNGVIVWAEGFLYDLVGRITHKIDKDGKITKYCYDEQSYIKTVYYPFSSEILNHERLDIEDNGLNVNENGLQAAIYWLSSYEYSELCKLIGQIQFGYQNKVTNLQNAVIVTYTYDVNGNRESKTNCFGKVYYKYDDDDKLIHSGDAINGTSYTYDANGNLLTVINKRKTYEYKYTPTNRMSYAKTIDFVRHIQTETIYEYDALNRRTIVQDTGGDKIRTLYDGQSFCVIRENPVLGNGSFTSNTTNQLFSSKQTNVTDTGVRYRFTGDNNSLNSSNNTNKPSYLNQTNRTNMIEEDSWVQENCHTSPGIVYVSANENPIAVISGLSNTNNKQGNPLYIGSNNYGTIYNVSDIYGNNKEEFIYDAFGSPLSNNKDRLISFGYCGKPFDFAANTYNYGFRDYAPNIARFTTKDPIKDGTNWYSYTMNDPINFVDVYGLHIKSGIVQAIMSDPKWGNEITGNGVENMKLSQTGCTITEYARVLSGAIGKEITPKDINDNKDNFIGDLLCCEKLVTENGGQFSVIDGKTQDIVQETRELLKSNNGYYLSACVTYKEKTNTDGSVTQYNHWIGIADIVIYDGKTYYEIIPTSINDSNPAARHLSTWKFLEDGRTLVEASAVRKMYSADFGDKKNF